MGPLEVMAVCRQAGVQVTVSAGRVVAAADGQPPEAVRAAARAAVDVFRAVVAGAGTGHAWGPCSECGQGRMISASAAPACSMTPGCNGRHQRTVASAELVVWLTGRLPRWAA